MIENLGGQLLSEKKYYDSVNDDKHVEIDVLKTKDLVNAIFALRFPFGTWGDMKGRNSAQSGGGESGMHHILLQSLHTVMQPSAS